MFLFVDESLDVRHLILWIMDNEVASEVTIFEPKLKEGRLHIVQLFAGNLLLSPDFHVFFILLVFAPLWRTKISAFVTQVDGKPTLHWVLIQDVSS